MIPQLLLDLLTKSCISMLKACDYDTKKIAEKKRKRLMISDILSMF